VNDLGSAVFKPTEVHEQGSDSLQELVKQLQKIGVGGVVKMQRCELHAAASTMQQRSLKPDLRSHGSKALQMSTVL
jgi:hypothetical protein